MNIEIVTPVTPPSIWGVYAHTHTLEMEVPVTRVT